MDALEEDMLMFPCAAQAGLGLGQGKGLRLPLTLTPRVCDLGCLSSQFICHRI